MLASALLSVVAALSLSSGPPAFEGSSQPIAGKKAGWEWLGDGPRSIRDYQHFSADGS